MRLTKKIVFLLSLLLLSSRGAYLYADEMSDLKKDPEFCTKTCPMPSTPGLLMDSLDKVGVAKHLDKLGIKIYGYADAGYMYDTTAPQPYAGPTFQGFNNVRNTPLLNKVALKIERTVDPAKKEFDLGFCAEGLWGYDARWIHSNGLGDTQTGRYQWDFLVGYVDVALPYIPAKIRAGKWIELAGFEQFDANLYGAFCDPSRAFYSYSYQFLYAEPGTQTGILGTYVFNPQLTIDAGFTEGWNQSTRNTDGLLDFLGRITYLPTDKTAVIFVMTAGPEYPISVGHNLPEPDKAHYWTALDLVVTHKVTDKLSLGVGNDWVITPQIPGLPEGTKQWGGVAGYISYAINQYMTFNTRIEWYDDAANGYSTGAANGANYFEYTTNLAIRPFPNDKVLSQVLFRPEIRFDWSDRSVFAKGDRTQFIVGGDVLFTF